MTRKRIVIEYEQDDAGKEPSEVLRLKSDFKPENEDDFIAGDYALLCTVGIGYANQYGHLPDFENKIAAEAAEVASRVIRSESLAAARRMRNPHTDCLCETCKKKLN